MSLPHGMETMSDWGVLLTRTQAKLHLKLNFKFDQKNSGSPLQWKSSCWWSHRARGLLPPEGHLGSPGSSSGPWAPTHLLQSLSGSLSGLSPHSLVGSKRCQEIQFQCQPFSAARFVFKIRKVWPPPQRRQRARSFPVPSGRTATGGRDWRFSLSAITHASVSLWGKLMNFYTWTPKRTKTPIASRSQPTVPSPPHAKILYSCRLRKKCSLGKKTMFHTEDSQVIQYIMLTGEPYPGVGPPFDKLYTWRGFSRYWNFLSTLQRNNKTDEKDCRL